MPTGAVLSRTLVALALAMAAPLEIAAQVAATPPKAQHGAPRPAAPLGIPIRKVMNAVIDFWAFGVLFLNETKPSLSEEDWQSLELASINLMMAATSITAPGTGPNDPAWTSDTEWQKWAREMQEAAKALGFAVQQRNRSALKTSANRLADSCLACHTTFKPKRADRQTARDD